MIGVLVCNYGTIGICFFGVFIVEFMAIFAGKHQIVESTGIGQNQKLSHSRQNIEFLGNRSIAESVQEDETPTVKISFQKYPVIVYTFWVRQALELLQVKTSYPYIPIV